MLRRLAQIVRTLRLAEHAKTGECGKARTRLEVLLCGAAFQRLCRYFFYYIEIRCGSKELFPKGFQKICISGDF